MTKMIHGGGKGAKIQDSEAVPVNPTHKCNFNQIQNQTHTDTKKSCATCNIINCSNSNRMGQYTLHARVTGTLPGKDRVLSVGVGTL